MSRIERDPDIALPARTEESTAAAPSSGDSLRDRSAAELRRDPLADVREGNIFLAYGSQGERVAALQSLLNARGAFPPLELDGKFGPLTRTALAEFQFQSGIHVDGIAGPETMGAFSRASVLPGISRFAIDAPYPTPWRTPMIISAAERPDELFKIAYPCGERSNFERALHEVVLPSEGGLNADPHDRGNRGGNVTYRGVTQAAYDAYSQEVGIATQRVDTLDIDQIQGFYHRNYWERGQCDNLPAGLAVAHFDTCVNMGVGGATKILQRALQLPVTGRMDATTLAAVEQSNPEELLTNYSAAREAQYRVIAQRGDNARYLDGWLNRTAHVRDAALRIASTPCEQGELAARGTLV